VRKGRVDRVLEAVLSLSEEQRRQLLQRLAREYGLSVGAATAPLPFPAAQVEGPTDYVVLFDGGSRGNPGPGYGSYCLTRAADGPGDLMRLDFGREMTGNEAEYRCLIAALEGLLARVEAAGQDVGALTVEVRGDSALVIHQVEGTWRARDDRMRVLRNRVRELLARFRGYRLVLCGREEVVRVLGH